MTFSLDKVFGLHEQALLFRAKRAELLSANLTNADTPNFKARDIDFQSLLRNLEGSDTGSQLSATHSRHVGSKASPVGSLEILYRSPLQPRLDGNTVDSQREQSAYLQNALAYQTSLRFLDSRIQGLRLAIRGE